MSKLQWNEFILKHRAGGHLVITGTFSTRFQMPPNSIIDLMEFIIDRECHGDWSHETKIEKLSRLSAHDEILEIGAATLHRFVFEHQEDAITIAGYFRARSLKPLRSPESGFATYLQGREINDAQYEKLAAEINYPNFKWSKGYGRP